MKNCCILHGRVFVMDTSSTVQAGLLKCTKLIVVAQKRPGRSNGLKCWWMTERSLEWILLTLRIVLSGEDNFEEELSTKTNPR